MEQQEQDLRMHLYAYVRLAIGGSPTDEVSKGLQKLCSTTFPSGYPSFHTKTAPSRRLQPERNSGAGIDFGFAPRERAFWITRHYLPNLGLPADAFDKGRPFDDYVGTFAEKYGDDWLSRRLGIRLHQDDDKFLKTQGAKASDLRPLGLIVAGSLHGIVWIGTVRDASIVREDTGKVRVSRIQQLVQAVAVPREAGWSVSVSDATLLEVVRKRPSAFVTLAVSEIERLSKGAADAEKGISSRIINGFSGLIQCLCVEPQSTASSSMEKLQVELEKLTAAQIDGVAVVSDLPVEVAARTVEAFDVSQDGPTPRFFVADPRTILTLSADRPWVWNEHLSTKADGYQVAQGANHSRLESLLLPSWRIETARRWCDTDSRRASEQLAQWYEEHLRADGIADQGTRERLLNRFYHEAFLVVREMDEKLQHAFVHRHHDLTMVAWLVHHAVNKHRWWGLPEADAMD
jgi:hypothetical protein